MLNTKQAENFKMSCAQWLEAFLKSRIPQPIKAVYAAGKVAGFTRAEIKAARAWHGSSITTLDDSRWGWET